MSEEPKIDKHIKVEPAITITRDSNFGTIAADYVKVMTNRNRQNCTLTFFQTHAIPKIGPEGIIIESVEEQMILEVKIPIQELFNLALYLTGLFKDIQANPHSNYVDFGPSAIRVSKEPPKEK